MTRKKRVSVSIGSSSLETKSLSLRIENIHGIHLHVRNGEKFRGQQKDCPLCANGSEFEKAMGKIGAA